MNEERRPFRKIWLVIISVLLGGATLGVGAGAGYAIVRHFAPAEAAAPAETEQPPGVTTIRLNPLVVPIDPSEPSFVDIIPLVKDAVVSVNITATATGVRGPMPGAGSGFIFAEDDEYVFIATNNHVIENAVTITVSLDDDENVPAIVIGYDRNSDLAVLAVSKEYLEEKGVPFTIAKLGDSSLMRMGDTVVAIGNAMGEGQTVTKGIISALNLNIEVNDPSARNRLNLNVLQTDAAVNRGNSGGPLVNRHGEVIGIITAKLLGADIEGMGYALPSNNVYEIIMELKEAGSVRQPYIGIGHWPISEILRDTYNLPSVGLIVTDVLPDTPAETAGLRRGDLIVSFGGRIIQNPSDLSAALSASRPGDEVIFGVYRAGERIELTVVLGSRVR